MSKTYINDFLWIHIFITHLDPVGHGTIMHHYLEYRFWGVFDPSEAFHSQGGEGEIFVGTHTVQPL